MSRVQLALNVTNLDDAVVFYSKLFAAEPAKRRPGYANFALCDPPLKLVLIENADSFPGSVNHLGVEVQTVEEVMTAKSRLQGNGLATRIEARTECCYALQDKVWVKGPGGEPWEIYTVLADTATPGEHPASARSDGSPSGACCTEQVTLSPH